MGSPSGAIRFAVIFLKGVLVLNGIATLGCVADADQHLAALLEVFPYQRLDRLGGLRIVDVNVERRRQARDAGLCPCTHSRSRSRCR